LSAPWIVRRPLAVLVLGLGLLAASACAAVEQKAALRVPAPQGYVNDYAGVLKPQERARLEDIAAALKSATGAELAIVVMPSIAPYDDFTYALAVFDKWKLGEKGRDNGLLVFLALQERRIRILTGYGLEGILPDGKLGRFRDAYLVPYLRQGKVGEGLVNISLVLAQTIAEAEGKSLTGAAGQKPRPAAGDAARAQIILWLVLFGVALVVQIMLYRARRSSGYLGGVFYGGGMGGFGGGFSGGFGGFGGGATGGGGVGGGW